MIPTVHDLLLAMQGGGSALDFGAHRPGQVPPGVK